jgi:hypothetical protein
MLRRFRLSAAAAVAALALFLAAPPAGLCEGGSVTQINTGWTPAGDLPGKHSLFSAAYCLLAPPDLGMAFFSTAPAGYQVSVGSWLDGAFRDLSLDSSGAAITCSSPAQVALGWATTPGADGRCHLNVAALCGGSVHLAQSAPFAPGETPASWGRRELAQPFGPIETPLSLASVSPQVPLTAWALPPLLCVTHPGGRVYCYDLDPGGSGVLPGQQFTAPQGRCSFAGNLHHCLDGQGRVHMAGTNGDGQLIYTMFRAGDTQAEADSFMNLGQASQNQAWNWVQVGAAPDGTVYVSAFNTAEGSHYVLYQAGSAPEHWYFLVVTSAAGPVGMYNSMAVDNLTGNAVMTFADSEGRARALMVTPDGRWQMTTFDAGYGQPHSTATAAAGGQGDNLWLVEGLDYMSARIGAKIEF